jgi:single stranded DNA-binding protein
MKKTKNEEQNLKAAPPYKNHVTLVGYLGDNPEQRNGHAVLSLATKTSWLPKDSKEWKERTEWHRIVAWGPLAEAVKPLAKGDHVLIEGELRSNEYEADAPIVGKKNATARVNRRTWEIRARHVRKLDHKKQEKPKKAA